MTPVGYLSLHNIYYELRNRLMIELIIGQNNSNIASVMMLATSVVSQISVEDLFHAASIVQSRTFRDFEVYTVIGVLYLGLAFAFRGLFAGIYYWAFVRR